MLLTRAEQALIKAGQGYAGALAFQAPLDSLLQSLAKGQAQLQADRRMQGHQYFQARFDRVLKELGMVAREVAAESWPWQRNLPLLDVGNEMLKCWRQSDGHWDIVSSECDAIGASMACGSNGTWYATVLVARKQT